MEMKRTISLILALTMLVGLCSCADQPSQDNQGNPDSQTAAAFTPEGLVYQQQNLDDRR